MKVENNTIQLVAPIHGDAGNCLTMANWERAGIKTLAYRLSDLLMKPGLEVLNRFGSLREYVGWSGQLALIVDVSKTTSAEKYHLRSRYDGSEISLDEASFAELVMKLNPDLLILPSESNVINTNTTTIVPRYLRYDEASKSLEDIVSTEGAIYIEGFLPPSILASLKNEKRQVWVESSKPAIDGLNGILYHQNGNFSVLDPSMKHEHKLIDENCKCETCEQKLTRAYLHHLLQQTPLLAHRFMIQHNVYWYISQFG